MSAVNRSYLISVMMVLLGGTLLSVLGIGIRLIESASSLQIMFYRSVTQALFLALMAAIFNAKAPTKPFTTLGKRGYLASFCLGLASLFMISSIVSTSVANAVFIVSLAPLCCALLGRFFLDEQVTPTTWLAMSIALFGIFLVVKTGLNTGGKLGMAFAFCMMLLYSISLILIRSQQQADMFALCSLSGVVLAVGIFPWIDDFSISANDLMICVLLGIFQIGLGLVLITKAAERLPAAQVSILALTEVVLSPVWVWIFVGEETALLTIIGGAIVLAGVALQALAAANEPAAANS
ncbi:MAG: DMT family transporter [Pseudomonadota bacterium]